MITVFNRREVAITRDLTVLAAVRDALERGGVAYVTRSEGLGSAGRGRGLSGTRYDTVATYRVYVHKSCYEKARYLLGPGKSP